MNNSNMDEEFENEPSFDEEAGEDEISEQIVENVKPKQEMQRAKPKKAAPVQKQQQMQQSVQEEPEERVKPRYVAYIVQPAIGIRDTVTGESTEGFQDAGVAQGIAMMLNNQERFMVSAGYS